VTDVTSLLPPFSTQWSGVPIAGAAVFVVGGAMYLMMSARPAGLFRGGAGAPTTHRPGWAARSRARGGSVSREDALAWAIAQRLALST
jgi:hypothetical protein